MCLRLCEGCWWWCACVCAGGGALRRHTPEDSSHARIELNLLKLNNTFQNEDFWRAWERLISHLYLTVRWTLQTCRMTSNVPIFSFFFPLEWCTFYPEPVLLKSVLLLLLLLLCGESGAIKPANQSAVAKLFWESCQTSDFRCPPDSSGEKVTVTCLSALQSDEVLPGVAAHRSCVTRGRGTL